MRWVLLVLAALAVLAMPSASAGIVATCFSQAGPPGVDVDDSQLTQGIVRVQIGTTVVTVIVSPNGNAQCG
jgi:hypothetical protein